MSSELLYQIGLTLLNGVGDVNAKTLLAYCGGAQQVFQQKKTQLLKIPGIGGFTASAIVSAKPALKRAEQEIRFIERENILPLFFNDTGYPSRLKQCNDSPVLLYFKGQADLNTARVISVIGTRRPSEAAKTATVAFINDLSNSGVLVVSGLAYGIDVLAHKAALGNDLPTVGVLGHGLDRMYPSAHRRISERMLEAGGLLTEFTSATNPDAVNFPKRNRIVAGLSDAVVVIESGRKGGSLITATIANSYNRDVFPFPGRAGDLQSEGCNGLIKRNRAALIENGADLLDAMQWLDRKKTSTPSAQIPLAIQLDEEERRVFDVLNHKKSVHLDQLCAELGFPVSKTSALLLQLEFSNLVKSKPGKMFEVF